MRSSLLNLPKITPQCSWLHWGVQFVRGAFLKRILRNKGGGSSRGQRTVSNGIKCPESLAVQGFRRAARGLLRAVLKTQAGQTACAVCPAMSCYVLQHFPGGGITPL